MNKFQKNSIRKTKSNDLCLGEQGPSTSKRARVDANGARAGIINRMVLKNFMCHSQLEVEFNNNISIVIGRNGSGKSAILTALIVGLGGKATMTNRGSNIKGFIRAGRNSGSVEIEIYNGGSMAYRPTIYGSKITIKRTITCSGSSSYRIQSETGEVIATNVREIQNITNCLNIQVDNPICILNQDTSRNFLNSNDPRHKFTLFMKATRLEVLSEEYKQIINNHRESSRIFEDKKKNFSTLVQDLKKFQEKVEQVKSLSTLEHKISEVQKELFWAKVRDVDAEVEAQDAIIQVIKSKETKLIDKIENRSKQIDDLKAIAQTLLKERTELKEAIEVQSRPHFDVQNNLDELRRNLNEKRKQKQTLSTSLEIKQKDIQVLQRDINNTNENTSRVQEQRLERERNISDIEDKLKQLEDRIQTLLNEQYQLKCDASRKEQECQQLRSEIHEIDSRILNEKNSLNVLNNESGNELLLYGRDMPRVKQLIQQNRNKFRHLPKGPLGSYICLKDKKWALAAESYLGSRTLGAFTVDNQEDSIQLNEIFKKVLTSGRTPTIIISKFIHQKHNVRANLVHAPHDCASLYDILEIEDSVISNCIVDQMAIEGILLINNDNRAIQLMSNRTCVPQKCTQSVTVAGDKYYPDPNYKTYASQTKRAMYLQADVKGRVEQIQSVINSLQQERTVMTERKKSTENDAAEHLSHIRKLEEKNQRLNEMKTKLRRELTQLKSVAEPEVVNVQYLETELSEVHKEILVKKSDLSRIQEESEEIRNLIRENEEKLRTLKISTKNLEDRLNFLEGELKENAIKQKEISTSEPFDQKQLRTLQAQMGEACAEKEVKFGHVQRYMEQAATFGARHLGKRNVQTILDEISTLERSIRRLETETEDAEFIQQKYQHLFEKYKVADDIMEKLDEDVRELRLAIEKRKRHYVLTQEYFITLIKHSFKKIMDVRQFQGSIEINVSDKKLDLVVIPQQGSQGLTNSSNLSGGERSFSTVAFLYSLWQCMEFPFYILDEFDVYMDKLNRTKVIDILLHHAESHPHLQYVFLTPQDVSFIDRKVSILRLDDPERIAI